MNRTKPLLRVARFAGLGAIAAAVLLMPAVVQATQSAGMPWSPGMNQLSTEAKGGLAFAFILMGCVGGFAEYMNNGQLSMLLMLLARAGIVIGAVGGIVFFASMFGMTAALV